MKITEITSTDIPNRVEQDGNVYYFDDQGRLHRDNGLPAIEWKDGRKSYYQHGVEYHPEKSNTKKKTIKSATKYFGNMAYKEHTITWPDGTVEIAQERPDGYTIFLDAQGKYHRDYKDLPAVYGPDHRSWCKHGATHRENDRPAYVSSKVKKWMINGIPHRDNGKAAIIWSNGDLEWWIDGVLMHSSTNDNEDTLWFPNPYNRPTNHSQ